MAGATGNIYVGLSEFADMMLALHFLRKGVSFLTLEQMWAAMPYLRPVFVERTHGDPNTVRNLKRNLAINHLDELVTV
jgi:hypothetical protein